MPATTYEPTLFPSLTRAALLAFQFSSWYPKFAPLSIKSTVIRPLSREFYEYLDSDGVFVPEGSENLPVESTLSDEEQSEDSDEEETCKYSFPELDAQIRQVVAKYGAVFPKLNFSSPRDAAWVLPASSPLKCVSPADVYLLLKSSDFVQHDLDQAHVFEDVETDDSDPATPYEIELVLRKWYPVDRSRELRCFVRKETLIGIAQRDPNYYEFWNESDTQGKVMNTVLEFWEKNIKGKFAESGGDYVFDFLLTRDLTRGHILDFNPYGKQTDPLLFTYNELFELLKQSSSSSNFTPQFKVIDSRGHPAAARNAPTHQHNMVPIEALTLSSGRNVEEFASLWQEELRKSAIDSDADDEN